MQLQIASEKSTQDLNRKSNQKTPIEKGAKIWKQNEKSKDKRIDKIVKDKTKPSPGEYNTYEAWRKTKLGNREYTAPKAKLINFTEIIKANKKISS